MLLLLIPVLTAQNLVPNPSFEDYNDCPNGLQQLYNCKKWASSTPGTPDYFNSCANELQGSTVAVPHNMLGTQLAHSGQAYVGIIVKSKNELLTEYLTIKLTKALKAGVRYCVEFYVSPADNCVYGIDALAACLTTAPLKKEKWESILRATSIRNTMGKVLTDKTKWTKISGIYESVGKEQYLTIGNFDGPTLETTEAISSKGRLDILSYYYIDDVSVGPADGGSGCVEVLEPGTDGSKRIYPKNSSRIKDPSTSTTTKKASTSTINKSPIRSTAPARTFDTPKYMDEVNLGKVKQGASFILRNVTFDHDQWSLDDVSRKELDELADIMRLFPEMVIELGGHTDDDGSGDYNQQFSKKRIETVAGYLLTKQINGSRINYRWYGSEKPIADNSNAEGRRINRRVEVKILEK